MRVVVPDAGGLSSGGEKAVGAAVTARSDHLGFDYTFSDNLLGQDNIFMATIAALISETPWPKNLWQLQEFSARFPSYNASIAWKASTPAGFSEKLVTQW